MYIFDEKRVLSIRYIMKIGGFVLKRYSATTYAILGLLTTHCRTGYDIKRMIDTSLSHFWKISYGQIYPSLKLLVEDGLIERHDQTGSTKVERVEYTLTNEGQELLKQWLQEPVEKFSNEKNEVLLRLFLSDEEQTTTTIQQIEKYRAVQYEKLETYELIEHSLRTGPVTTHRKRGLLTLQFGKKMSRAIVEWCDETITELR